MHINKLTTLAVAVVATVGSVACNSDKLTNLNNNPNNPTSAPPGPVFTQAVRNSATSFVSGGFSLRGTEWVMQHWAEVQYPQEDEYQRLDPASTSTWFLSPYSAQLVNLKKLADQGKTAKDATIYGPADVMLVWNFSYLTNTWGDIPYSQALKADSGIISPAYDAQKDIFNSFYAILNQVSADLSTTVFSNSLGSADPVYSGSKTKWQKFANSLHARVALQIINADPTTAKAELTKAFTAPGGVFASNADMATIKWPGDGTYDNPITTNFSSRDDHRVSNTFFNAMNQYNDPRIPILMQPTLAYQAGTSTTEYAGMPNGLSQDSAGKYFSISSRPGAIFWPGKTSVGTIGSSANKTNPSYFMTYAEVAFIEAEAVERGLVPSSALPGTAASYYTAGITASMQQWGVPTAQINTFLAQPSVQYQGGEAGLKQIALQKWIALVTDGGQTWAEWRRTCVPLIHPGPAAVDNQVPRRFYYPTSEYSTNGANLQAAIARQGPDNFNTHVWWDVPANSPTCDGGNGNG